MVKWFEDVFYLFKIADDRPTLLEYRLLYVVVYYYFIIFFEDHKVKVISLVASNITNAFFFLFLVRGVI